MNQFSIREAQRRDIEAISSLWREMMEFHSERDARFQFAVGAERDLQRHLQETLRSRLARICVAEADSRIIGYGLGELHARRPLYPAGDYGLVSDLCVTKDWQRRAVGRALAADLLASFRC